MKKYSDHAFASGPVYKTPKYVALALTDRLIYLFEKWYGAYCIRQVWQTWSQSAQCEKGVQLGGNARLINKNHREAVYIGEDAVCKGIIRIEPKGRLHIGREVYIGDNTLISASLSITIGEGTLIAHNVQIFDNTSHPISYLERHLHFRKLIGYKVYSDFNIPSSPVCIGENCWLGMNSIILKGVNIGDRSIIGAGSVITKDIPSDTLVVGGGNRLISLLN